MKKLILSMVMVAAFAAFADDATTYQALYWQVNAEDTTAFGDAAYACLYASLNGDTVRINGDGRALSDGALGSTKSVLQGTDSAFSWGSYDFTTANFFVELLNENGDFLAKSEGISYANLAPYLDRNYSGSTVAGHATGAATFSSYAVPEPTSSLLMLLGIAMFALRRRACK